MNPTTSSNQRQDKNKTILPVTKRMLGDRMASRTVRMQNRELMFKVIACNMHGLTVFMVWFLLAHKAGIF